LERCMTHFFFVPTTFYCVSFFSRDPHLPSLPRFPDSTLMMAVGTVFVPPFFPGYVSLPMPESQHQNPSFLWFCRTLSTPSCPLKLKIIILFLVTEIRLRFLGVYFTVYQGYVPWIRSLTITAFFLANFDPSLSKLSTTSPPPFPWSRF